MSDDCEHNFRFQGTVYGKSKRPLFGGEYAVSYEDMYYCTKCLEVRHLNHRYVFNNEVLNVVPLPGVLPK